MIDVIMLIIIGSWFYQTAHERGQSKAVWVTAGMGGYLAGEFGLGWHAAKLIIDTNASLWYLQTLVIVSSGLLVVLMTRFALLSLWKVNVESA